MTACSIQLGSEPSLFSHAILSWRAQVTRRWMNWEGQDVVKHLADQLHAMDELVMTQAAAASTAAAQAKPEAAAAAQVTPESAASATAAAATASAATAPAAAAAAPAEVLHLAERQTLAEPVTAHSTQAATQDGR